MKISIYLKTLTAGFYTSTLRVLTCYPMAPAASMKRAPGSVVNMKTTTASMTNPSPTLANIFSRRTSSWKNTVASVSRSGTSVSSYTNNPVWLGKLLSITALLCSTPLHAADAGAPTLRVDDQIAVVAATFATLDDMAASCLASLGAQPGQSAQALTEDCQTFLAAIDGEPTANYIQHCQQLQQWRSAFVEQSRAAPDDSNDPDALRRLIDIEYFCGDNALRLRTDNVASAYQSLQRDTNGVRPGISAPPANPIPDNHRQQLRRLNSENQITHH